VPRPDEDKGLIEDFFDSLFGDDKEEPAPAPRGAQPGFGPRHQSRNEVPSAEDGAPLEDRAAEAVSQTADIP
jgi:hypothetical protein